MSNKHLHFSLLIVIGLLLIALIGSAYGVNKLLGMQANNLINIKAKSLALQKEQIGLQKAKNDVVTYADLEKITRTIVPEDKTQAEAVREIVNIASANGINLGSITFPASTLGNSAPVTANGISKPISPVVKAPAGTSITSKTDKLSQLLPVSNIPGVYELTITVQSDSSRPVAYSKFIGFLAGLEKNRRTAQVSTITLSPTSSNLVTFNLTINEYIKP